MKKENLEIFDYLNKVYSKAKCIDYVKYLYEVYMGSSHYKTDEEGIIKTLEKEKFNIKPKHTDYYLEPIGDRYVRVALSRVLSRNLSIYTFVRLYILSRDYYKGDLEEYKVALVDLREAIKEDFVHFSLSDYDSFLKDYAKDGYPPVHHSDKYKSRYNPHYLLLSKKVTSYLREYREIDELILKKEPIQPYLDSINKSASEFIKKHWKEIYPSIDL